MPCPTAFPALKSPVQNDLIHNVHPRYLNHITAELMAMPLSLVGEGMGNQNFFLKTVNLQWYSASSGIPQHSRVRNYGKLQ